MLEGKGGETVGTLKRGVKGVDGEIKTREWRFSPVQAPPVEATHVPDEHAPDPEAPVYPAAQVTTVHAEAVPLLPSHKVPVGTMHAANRGGVHEV